jgi:IclR family pca regulon transcriptional regulator
MDGIEGGSGGAQDDRAEARLRPAAREAGYSRMFERGLGILACFAPERPVLGSEELAQMCGIGRGSAFRFASALVGLGYLEQTRSRKYRLSPRVIDLGMAAFSAIGLRGHARSQLQELARASGLDVALGVLDGSEVLVVEEVRPPMRKGRPPAHADSGAGARLPAYCTSLGKVLLAHLPSDWQDQLTSEMQLLERGPKTITSLEELREELENVRTHALGSSDEELLAHTCAIAAPVRDETGDVLAAVSVASRRGAIGLEGLVKRNAKALESTAQQISARLGWSGG